MTIFLISNGSLDTYPNNTLTNFKNKLPTILEHSENDNWCMGIESIGFSTNFRNIELPKNPEAPSFMLTNCQYKAPKCPQMCVKELSKTMCTVADDECLIKVDFKFQENEDNQFCWWEFYRFEDKFYTFEDMEVFFQRIRNKHEDAFIGLENDYRFTITNKDKNSTNNDLWILISDSMMSTFKIPKYHSKESTDYFKKTGAGKYELVRKFYEQFEYVHNELPYITNFKGDKYYAFRLESEKKTEIPITLSGRRDNHISHPEKTFPTLIKVVSADVKQQIFNSSYSKDLLCFCPDFSQNDKYYFHEFENRQYVPLSNTNITDLNIKLLDHNNNPITLLKGVSTIVKLDIKKMEEQFFNVRLTSTNVNSPNNTKSSFKVKLPNTLSLDRSWKVCLTSISHPNTFKTFMPDVFSRNILIRHKGVGGFFVTHQFTLQHKRYTKDELVTTLDKVFRESQIGRVEYNTDLRRLECRFTKEDVQILASNYMLKIMGYNGTLDEVKGFTMVKMSEHEHAITYNATDEVDKVYKPHILWSLQLDVDVDYLRPDYIICYTNIVSPTVIGSLYSKILRIIPIKNNNSSYVITEFLHKEYLELQNTEVSEVEIELRAHDGTLIEFGFEQDVILNLEFRQN
jgi:hypothetical protein